MDYPIFHILIELRFIKFIQRYMNHGDIMDDNSNPIDIAKKVAKEISMELGDNHMSTLVYDLPNQKDLKENTYAVPIFVVVDKFNSTVATKLAQIAQKWNKQGIEGPFIAEMNDLHGMEDSVPDELLNVARNYTVLEGTDILKIIPKFDKEHQRAQAELTIRRYIFTLRWTLPQVLYNNFQLKCYMNNLAFYCQLSIQLYHRITQPETRTPEDHLNKFYTEFPESRITLETLMNHIYNDKPLDDQPVELLTKTIDSVLQKILKKIDLLGKNNQEQPPTTLPTTQSPTPYSITSSEQPTNNETASQNQKPTTT